MILGIKLGENVHSITCLLPRLSQSEEGRRRASLGRQSSMCGGSGGGDW